MRGILHALEKQAAVLSRAPEVGALVKSLQVRVCRGQQEWLTGQASWRQRIQIEGIAIRVSVSLPLSWEIGRPMKALTKSLCLLPTTGMDASAPGDAGKRPLQRRRTIAGLSHANGIIL